MKIAVVAANGRVAKKVIAEAVSRGHEVVAFGRHDENDTQAKIYHKKDILELTKRTSLDSMWSSTALAHGRLSSSRCTSRRRSTSATFSPGRIRVSSLSAGQAAFT